MQSAGILTFHTTINYGGVLQAYALQTVLADMGCNAEIIDYFDSEGDLSSLSPLRRLKHLVWHGLVKKMLVGTVREQRTEKFRRDHLKLSARKYSDAALLHAEPPVYDVYITGSDQVWNPVNNHGDSSYFLSFAPAGKRLVSYAASFGVSNLDAGYAEGYGHWLKCFDFLSTREFEGKEIIYRLTGRDAEVLPDPTLLLNREQWKRVTAPYQPSRPYILCYYMPGDKKVNRHITQLSDKLARKTGWEVISIGQKEYMRLHPFRKTALTSGPSEFVGAFQNASFVITNSFHGTAFAANFKVPFVVPINRAIPPEQALSSRITTLLRILQLECRLIDVDQPISEALPLEVDFENAAERLENERKRAFAFLSNVLKGQSNL